MENGNQPAFGYGFANEQQHRKIISPNSLILNKFLIFLHTLLTMKALKETLLVWLIFSIIYLIVVLIV